MSTGALETIATQLTELNANFTKMFSNDSALAQPKPAAEPEADATPDSESAPKKVAAKKVAAKKASVRKAPAKKKGDDLSNITLFKKRLFEIADATGIEEVMPQLKKFIKDAGYASSDEIEVSDREEFLKSVTLHFNKEAAEKTPEVAEEDDFDI